MKVEIEHLSKSIKGSLILDDINLTLTSGKIHGLRGKNGSGKTMFMRALCGLILPSQGKILIDGEELGKELSFPRSVGVLLENPSFLPGYTGFWNLKILASIKGCIDDQKIKDTLTRVGLEPGDMRKYRKYSLGMKQRLGIACAIMEEPDLIILDEPINALDENGVALVKQILLDLKNKGALIVVACHDREELEFLSDEIYFVENGRIKKEEQKPDEKEVQNSN